MACRAFIRVAQNNLQGGSSTIPQFLLPWRQHLSTISTTTTTTDPAPPPGSFTSRESLPTLKDHDEHHSMPEQSPVRSTARYPQLSRHSALPKPIAPFSQSSALLPALIAQKPHYMTIHIHARPYMITEGDSIRLPFLMPEAPIGTILRLNRASILGSRDFTFRGDPWIDEQHFLCRAIVTAIEQEPERVKIKKKQRNRKTKKVKSQHKFTVLRIMEAKVRLEGDEVDKQGGD